MTIPGQLAKLPNRQEIVAAATSGHPLLSDLDTQTDFAGCYLVTQERFTISRVSDYEIVRFGEGDTSLEVRDRVLAKARELGSRLSRALYLPTSTRTIMQAQHGEDGTFPGPDPFFDWITDPNPDTVWKGIYRAKDPVKYAGQVLRLQGAPFEDGLVDAAALIQARGFRATPTAYANPKDLRPLRLNVSGQRELLHRKGVTVLVVADDDCPIGRALVSAPGHLRFAGLGEIPQLLNYDAQWAFRTNKPGEWEIRLGYYGNTYVHEPEGCVAVHEK